MKRNLFAALLAVAVIAPASFLSTTAFAGSIEARAYNDVNYQANRQKAISMLTARGYQVTDIDVDDYRGQPVFEVEAIKNNHQYDIVLSYPELKIIKERVDF